MNKQQRKYREMCGPPPARVFPKTSRGSLGPEHDEVGVDSQQGSNYNFFSLGQGDPVEEDLRSIRGQRL